MSERLSVLVGGATGQQGGAVARLLLESGHKVVGVTRKPESESAATLRERRADIAVGSLEDANFLGEVMQGVDAAFTMSTPFEDGLEAETRQGVAFADSAKAAGVSHLVYSSVGSADRNTGIPHFDSKYEVEQHITGLDVPYTIVRPVYFFENVSNLFLLPALKKAPWPLDFQQTRRSSRSLSRTSPLSSYTCSNIPSSFSARASTSPPTS